MILPKGKKIDLASYNIATRIKDNSVIAFIAMAMNLAGKKAGLFDGWSYSLEVCYVISLGGYSIFQYFIYPSIVRRNDRLDAKNRVVKQLNAIKELEKRIKNTEAKIRAEENLAIREASIRLLNDLNDELARRMKSLGEKN